MEALKALGDTYPNGRDHHVNGNTQRAVKEHCIRVEKVTEVAMEINQILEHVQEAINFKNERKG